MNPPVSAVAGPPEARPSHAARRFLESRAAALLASGLLLLLLAGVPFWPRLVQIEGSLRLAHAQVTADGAPQTVQLPHTSRAPGGTADYRLHFDLAEAQRTLPDPQEPLYLLLPLASQRAQVRLNGVELMDTGQRSLPTGIASGVTALVRLPADRLVAGRNAIDVRVTAAGVLPGYLAAPHVGGTGALAPAYRLNLFLLEHLRLMVLAGQLLLMVALLAVWLYRPADALFGWLLLMQALSLPMYLGLRADLPGVQEALPYVLIVSSTASLILPIIALLINGMAVPRWLRRCVVVLPCLGIALSLLPALPVEQVMLALNVPLAVLAIWAAVLITGAGAWRGVREARLLLAPMLLFALAGLHDTALALGWMATPVPLAAYYRMVLMIAIAVILMRRLGLSLLRLDGANTRLRHELAQREQELARLHAEEQREAVQRVRGEERRRLTADLHDGLSGHLASIIALAERERAGAIERSAREALDDLRVVIHSLDIGDRELSLALAGLRERLARQLKRLGIALEWSTAQLPEIAGVTPTHALNVLRIVQEAVTNAVRHGPATRIAVRGQALGPAHAALIVENDGETGLESDGACDATDGWDSGGAGLENMRRRAALLGGSVQAQALAGGGARVLLRLPLHLPPGSPP